MFKTLFTAAICAFASPAVAQSVLTEFDFADLPVRQSIALACQFSHECIDLDACADTTFSGELTGAAGGAVAGDLAVGVTMQSDSGDQELVGVLKDKSFKLMNIVGNGAHLLTIAPDGSARYAVHFPDVPMAITYHGQCKDAN
jgi:hypothetical protein